MFDHVGLRTRDLVRLAAFYEAALRPLGHVVASRDETVAALGPVDAPALWLHAGSASSSSMHLAFSAPSRQAVDAFHIAALAAGGRDNGAPGVRSDYSPNYYAAFVIDPDGNNAEAVCVG